MDNLFSCGLPELEEKILSMGEPRYRAQQLFQWIHAKGVFRAEEMKNLPKDFRRKLAHLLPPFPLALDEAVHGQEGTDKYRFRLLDGGCIEAVLIPEKKRLTLCLSTQVGCRMGCLFCRTGMMGWKRNLEPGEILGQYYAVRAIPGRKRDITHVVLMGMGEPLDNLENTLGALRIMTHPLGGGFSNRRITLSTVGLSDRLETLHREIPVSITLSLNAADDETRTRLMPVNRRYPVQEVLDVLRGLPLAPRRRFTMAYVLMKGVNDSRADARNLCRLLHGVRCKVNLIPFNPFPGTELKRPEESRVLEFQEGLRSRGLSTHVRFSRGVDILAACGQLADESSCFTSDEAGP